MGEMPEGVAAHLAEHAAHGPWRDIGGCVYCAPGCDARLYQGTTPADQEAFASALAAVIEEVQRRMNGSAGT